MIQLLNKKIKKTDINGNFILAHEHLDFDLRHIRKDDTSAIKEKELITSELKIIKEQGVGMIVDLSNQSMNSDKEALLKISEDMKIPVVCATGYYLNEYETKNNMSAKDIEKEFETHVVDGFGDTGIKAGIIGEIATSSEQIFEFEQKVFEAATNVQKKHGVPIYTHVNLGALAIQQVNLLTKLGAVPKKTIIGHLDLLEDKEVVKEIMSQGFNIGFDTIGKQSYLDDKIRAMNLIELINEGFEEQIVISLDISRQEYLKSKGGHGFGYLINEFFPLLKGKITEEQWSKISFKNILNILDR